jgi:hypothetical protein
MSSYTSVSLRSNTCVYELSGLSALLPADSELGKVDEGRVPEHDHEAQRDLLDAWLLDLLEFVGRGKGESRS